MENNINLMVLPPCQTSMIWSVEECLWQHTPEKHLVRSPYLHLLALLGKLCLLQMIMK